MDPLSCAGPCTLDSTAHDACHHKDYTDFWQKTCVCDGRVHFCTSCGHWEAHADMATCMTCTACAEAQSADVAVQTLRVASTRSGVLAAFVTIKSQAARLDVTKVIEAGLAAKANTSNGWPSIEFSALILAFSNSA